MRFHDVSVPLSELWARQPNGLRYTPSGFSWAGVDNAWDQYKLEARKMPINRGESQPSAARRVRPNTMMR